MHGVTQRAREGHPRATWLPGPTSPVRQARPLFRSFETVTFFCTSESPPAKGTTPCPLAPSCAAAAVLPQEALFPLPKPEQGALPICLSLLVLPKCSALRPDCPPNTGPPALSTPSPQQGREAPTGRGQGQLVFRHGTWHRACLREVASQTCVWYMNILLGPGN